MSLWMNKTAAATARVPAAAIACVTAAAGAGAMAATPTLQEGWVESVQKKGLGMVFHSQ